MKYDILIPAYNAENTIKTVLEQIWQLEKIPARIIVIDDGSNDNTAKIAAQMGGEVIRLSVNQGKGSALKTGFQYFLENARCDYLLCMDADLQHPVSLIPDFINFAHKYNCKLLIGNRKKTIKLMPLPRIISNKLTSFILSILTGQKIKDSQCGFRLIHKNILKNLTLDENEFQLESEMILKAVERHITIQFIDIPTIYNAQKSHINNIKVTFKFILLIAREIKKRLFNKMIKKNFISFIIPVILYHIYFIIIKL